MKTIEIVVAGLPVGQPRPRACMRGNHAGVYDPGTADTWKACVIHAAREVGFGNLQGPVELSVTFRMPRPKAHLRTNGEVKPSAPNNHTSKPDLDNLEKATMDALTAAGVWVDDSQVCRKWTSKVYSKNTGATIVVREVAE